MSVSSDVPALGWTRKSVGATVVRAMEDHLRQIGGRIRALREARGLTQDELGDLVGVREKTISRWENGKHQAVLGNARALAAALGVDVQDITGHLPAPLGLGASEDQVELMAIEFRGHVHEILTGLNRQNEHAEQAADMVRELLQRQSAVLANIEQLLARQSEVLDRIELLVETLPTDESTRRLTAGLAGEDQPDVPARLERAAADRATRER